MSLSVTPISIPFLLPHFPVASLSFLLSFTFVLCPLNHCSSSPFFDLSPPVLLVFLTLRTSPTLLCSPASSLALLHQQGQPASQQRASGCPPQQRPTACDTHPRLPAGPWLSNDDDPWATVALPQLTTRTCLFHTAGTGRGHRLWSVKVAR